MMTTVSAERIRLTLARSPWLVALLALGLGGLVGGATAFGPIYVVVGLFALAAAGAILVSVELGLLAIFAIITLLPFGTLPFRAVITPNFLTLASLVLFGVWVLRMLADSERFSLRLTPLGLPLLGFLGLTFFSLYLGARGLPDNQTLHNYVKFLLGVLLFFTVVNTVRTKEQARFALQGLILCGTAAAGLGLLLWLLGDALALQILTALGRIGYPTSGRVLRFVEDDTEGLERAIGTSVDPNSFGGMLALVGVLAATQIVATRPLLPRWFLVGCVGAIGLALLLTFSRAALFGTILGVAFLATVRYRRLWYVMLGAGLIGALLLLVTGIGSAFVERVIEGVQFQDQAQQMRLAEFQNAMAIIERYPVFGIGFGLAPDLDLTAGVSSIYLAMGQRIGLVGLGAFVALVGFWYALTRRSLASADEEEASWLLGCQAAIVAALAVGLADHYYFNIEFSHMVALFWAVAGLGIAVGSLRSQL
jgi:polysaccharide biosynthesis protein PslJ